MKTQQQQQARTMYFQTNSTRTEIADKLGVSRRSVYQWSVEGDWEKLRTSARNMPSMLAEKCYYLIGHFTDHLLQKECGSQSVTKADADILGKLVNTVNKLKKGSTINESMETFTFFMEGLQQRDAALADALLPHVDDFFTQRAGINPATTMLSGFNADGTKPFSEKDIMEKWQDEQDAEALLQEMKSNTPPPAASPAVPSASPAAPTGRQGIPAGYKPGTTAGTTPADPFPAAAGFSQNKLHAATPGVQKMGSFGTQPPAQQAGRQ